MKKALLIAEKSSLMNEIKSVYLKHKKEINIDIHFTCQAGHLVTLLLPNEIDEEQSKWCWENLPFHPKDYEGWKYKVIPSKTEKYASIKSEIESGKYDFIIHAGDPDQEGELLVNLVLNKVGNVLPVKRFWTNALTEKDILNALLTLADDNSPKYKNLYHSALARQHVDYLIGMNITEAASLKMGTLVSSGRCKTPICQIVYNREKEIENFVPKTDYELEVKYKNNLIGVLLDMESEEKAPKRFATKEELGVFTKKLSEEATVVSVQQKRVKQSAPELYSLSDLQVETSSKYGYSADETLAIVQSLYEKKVVSYPRTSCNVLSSTMDLKELLSAVSEIPELQDFVEEVTDEDIESVYNNKKYVNDKKMQEHGHYALSPTGEAPDITKLTEKEINVMMMIFRRFLAIFFPPIEQDKTQIITKNNDYYFRSSGKVLINEGYTRVLPRKIEDNELPTVKDGEVLSVLSYRAVDKTTTCPSRYTDGELIKVLKKPAKFLIDKSYKDLHENLHIGTEATRAEIIKQLIERDKFLEYVKGKGKTKYLAPSEKCKKVMENYDNRIICRVDLSGQMEMSLDEIRKGNLDYKKYEEDAYKSVNKMIDDIKNSNIQRLSVSNAKVVGKCPKCGGDILEGKKGYFCSNYKNGCQSKLFKALVGATITEKDIDKLLKGLTIEKTLKKEDREWKQKIKLDFEELSYEFVKTEKKSVCECPKCGGAIYESAKSFYCSNYKDGCTSQLWKSQCGATFTASDIKKLIDGETITKKMKRIDKKTGEEKTWTQKIALDFETLSYVFV